MTLQLLHEARNEVEAVSVGRRIFVKRNQIEVEAFGNLEGSYAR